MTIRSTHAERWIAIAWMAGFALCPFSLAIMADEAGRNGMGLIPWLGVVLWICAITGASYRDLAAQSATGPAMEVDGLGVVFGRLAGAAMPLCGRIVATLAGATGLLVTAGFVFNEVFVYWFPNFAFAYLLLGAILAVHLSGKWWIQGFQLVFSGVAALGLVVLVVVGLWVGESGSSPTIPLPKSGHGIPLALLWVFVGMEWLFLSVGRGPEASGPHFRYLVEGLVGFGVLIGLWTWISLGAVAADRLVGSTIGHTLVAKSIWGQSGRVTIGVVAISGVCAAVNGLFMSVSESCRLLTARGQTNPARRSHALWGSLPPIALTGAIGTLMALGAAGTEAVDAALRGGLTLVLILYAAVNVAALRQSRGRVVGSPSMLLLLSSPLARGGAASTLAVAAGVLVAGDPEKVGMIGFMSSAVIAVFFLVFCGFRAGRGGLGPQRDP
jgi:hypothetical protein